MLLPGVDFAPYTKLLLYKKAYQKFGRKARKISVGWGTVYEIDPWTEKT